MAVLLTGLTTFMFLPLLAIELTAQGIPAGRTGFLVGLLAFSSQAFSLLSGLLVDRLGPRRVMAAGFLLRIAGYVLLGLGGAGRPAPLVAGIVAVGVGGSMLGLSTKTLLVSQEGSDPRTMLALRSTFVNIGVVVGPALGGPGVPARVPLHPGGVRALAPRPRHRPGVRADGGRGPGPDGGEGHRPGRRAGRRSRRRAGRHRRPALGRSRAGPCCATGRRWPRWASRTGPSTASSTSCSRSPRTS
ncbi:hypothetical protein GCM10020254_29930 [Streptomyces goshikiensis]